ncbi:SGNH/GDSL hydrolase family protein [Zobellella iuensis]|uniref:SGNH/GDSL hydrolase family protein n=1 Tax=Zobellella iuensis TaxID=2803811 RepID=A0ABS1QSE0_9GAMM|nr:SGNH/GDSL hydrolase family protein [Zobellella iuensis]MBL1377765.1 SGNH/GDSL hydrolase family protein [Zobellella iuensis]
MNVLFVGGSNLVIKNGLSTIIPKILRDSGLDIENTYNISVGATTTLFGLESLSLFIKKDVDLIFIEYGINDLPLFVNDKALWDAAFTSLLSLVAKKYPSAHIVTILLGRQKDRFWNSQKKMHQRMREISNNFNALIVDIDSHLKNKRESLSNFSDFYLDESHYKSPSVTGYISQTIVSDYLLNKELGYFRAPPSRNTSESLSVYGISGAVSSFENSRFHKQTTILEKENSVEVFVKGNPVGISFISASDSCSLLIESEGLKKIINTKRKKSTAGKFSFILKQIPLYGFYKKDTSKKDVRKIKLTALDNGSKLWDADAVQRTYGMEPASKDSKGSVYISHISSF